MKMNQLQTLFFHEKSLERYTDRSVLELYLTTAGVSGDIPAMIDGLYSAFGSFKGILEAMPEQMMKVPNVTRRAASMIAMITPMTRIQTRSSMENPKTLTNLSEADAFCKSLLMGERNEQLYIIALDNSLHILGYRRIADGSLAEVQAYPRKIAEAALTYNACAIIMCHNHPGGTCRPSTEDIHSSKRLQRTLDAIGIQLLDHFIIAGSKTYSMVQNGDLRYEDVKPAEPKPEKKKKKKKAGSH